MHRGEGLHFAPAREAMADALRRSADTGSAWALAQRFVAPQLLFDDRPFYIRHALTNTHEWSNTACAVLLRLLRGDALQVCYAVIWCYFFARVWAVVTSVAPLRVWMFDGGLVVFSASKAPPTGKQDAPDQLKALGFNLWTQDRASTVVWRCAKMLCHSALGLNPPPTAVRLASRAAAPDADNNFGKLACMCKSGTAPCFSFDSSKAEWYACNLCCEANLLSSSAIAA